MIMTGFMKNNNIRSIAGVGPKLFLVSAMLSSPIIVVAYLAYPKFVIDTDYHIFFQIVGALLIITGVIFHAVSVITIRKAFNQNKLITTGIYGICRNPIYSASIIAIIPGVAIFLRMPFLLLVSVIGYITLRILIKKEETVLLQIFGREYQEYRVHVNAVFPTLFKR